MNYTTNTEYLASFKTINVIVYFYLGKSELILNNFNNKIKVVKSYYNFKYKLYIF